MPPGGPPLTLGWTGKAYSWQAKDIDLKEIFDVRTGEVVFKAETELERHAITISSADGAVLWQQVASKIPQGNCYCLSAAVFECEGGEKVANDANNQDVVLCADCEPKPTFS